MRAVDAFVYRVAKYIGAYAAAMNGVDAICFTAGLGENSAMIRRKVCGYLGYLGVAIREDLNEVRGQEIVISEKGAKPAVLVIPTNEELQEKPSVWCGSRINAYTKVCAQRFHTKVSAKNYVDK